MVSCSSCKKISVAKCEGCQQRYCMLHLGEHRQQLARELDEIGQDHDILKQDMTRNTQNHPLILQITEWEQRSIETIRRVAHDARADIQQWIQQMKVDLNTSVDKLTHELKARRDEDAYTEKDLERWKKQLQELRRQLEQPAMISIENDEKQPPLQMITVKKQVTFVGATHFTLDCGR